MRVAAAWALSLCACSSSTTVTPDGGGPVLSVTECTRAAVEAALADARSGDTVEIGACEIDAAGLSVPAGVALAGTGETTLTTGPVLLSPGDAHCTALRNLHVVSDTADAAIQTSGPGEVCIEDVVVTATLGRGIDARGTTLLTIRGTRLTGPVTPANAEDQPDHPADEALAATYGYFFECVERTVLEDAEAEGWSFAGAVVAATNLEWRGGGVRAGTGAGLVVHRSEVELADVEVAEVLLGLRLFPAHGLIATESRVVTSGLVSRDHQGYGVYQHGGEATHDEAEVLGNREGGLWTERGSLTVTRSRLDGNGMAAIATSSAGPVVVEDSTLGETVSRVRILGETGSVALGTGLFVTNHDAPFTLRRARFTLNETAAAIFTLPSPYTHAFVIEEVEITPGTQGFGVLGGPPPAGWESGITPIDATTYEPDAELAGLMGGGDLIEVTAGSCP